MKVFIDCEFNSMGGDLLSMGLVSEKGDEFYREFPLSNRAAWNGWVKDNVRPLLSQVNHQQVSQTLRDDIYSRGQAGLEKWLSHFDTVHVIADWPEDVKYFCDFLLTGPGERIDTPPLTMEIRRDLDAESKVPHHALWDARAIRDLYLELEKVT